MEPLRPEDFIVYQHQETFKDRVRTELRQIKTKRNIMQGLVNFSVKTVIERRKEEIEVLRKIGTLDQYLHWKDKAEPVKKKRKEQIHLEKEIKDITTDIYNEVSEKVRGKKRSGPDPIIKGSTSSPHIASCTLFFFS